MSIIQGVRDAYQGQVSKLEYWTLSNDIGKCNDIQAQLKEGREIMKAVKQKLWKEHPLYQQFDREYKELYETIKASYQSEKSFSQAERTKILLELWDMISLAEKEWIIEKKWVFSWFWDVLKKTDTQEAKNQAQSLRNKKIQEYSQEESIAAMEYLSNNYTKYKPVWNDKITKWITFMYSSINELDDQYEARLFQEDLMKKIFWEGKQFNDKYLVWFNTERGNFITSISDFEGFLKSPNTKMTWDENDPSVVNSRVLANYFLHLESIGKLNMTYLSTVLWSVKMNELQKIWKINPDSQAQKILATQLWGKNTLLKNFISYNEEYNEKISEKNYKEMLQNSPQKVFLVNDKDVLLKIISEIPNIKYTDIDFELQHDIDVIEAIAKKDPNFKTTMIPQSFYDIKINNQIHGVEKIKRVIKITTNPDDFLSIMWDISVYLDEGDIKALLKQLDWTHPRLQDVQKYLWKLSEITKDNFETAFQNLMNTEGKQEELIRAQIVDINLYVYKYWITGFEDQILQILDKYSLDSFPGIQKHLHTHNEFTQKLISKKPEYFELLGQKLKSDSAIVSAYIDGITKQGFDYMKLVNAVNNINFWDTISVVLLIYSKLSSVYSKQMVKNIFWHPYVSQKFSVFFKMLQNKEYWEWQLQSLEKLDGVFWDLREDFKLAGKVIVQVNQEYSKFESQEKDDIFLQKISQITQFEGKNWEINQKILDIVKSGHSIYNDKELYGLLQKWTWWNPEAVATIFKKLQEIKIEHLQKEIQAESEKLKDIWVTPEDVQRLMSENKINKEETLEQYQTRIIELVKKEKNIKLTQELEQSIKSTIKNFTQISEIKYVQQNQELYIQYLENPRSSNNFSDFKKYAEEQKELQLQWVDIPGTLVGVDFEKSTNGNYLVETSIWKIELTYPEWQMVSESEEAMKNLIHFKSTLDELNLDGLWKYREAIFTAISWKYTWAFNVKQEFINENEMKIFVSSVLSSIWISIDPQTNMDAFKQQVKQSNKVWLIEWREEVNVLWDGYIEKLFLQKFDSKRTGMLHTHVLQNEIWDIFWKTV